MNQKEAFLKIESYSEYVKRRDEFKGLKIDQEVLGHMAKIFPKVSGTKEELFKNPENRSWQAVTHEEFMKIVREKNEWYRHPEKWTEAEKLRERIMSGKKSKEEWLQLREDVRAFFESDVSEEDKEMLRGYTETLAMMCSAIEYYGYEP